MAIGSERSPPLHVDTRPSTVDHVCRCGTPIARGETYLQLSRVPERLVGLFSDQYFCSMACLRAFFLETLSQLDALDTPENEAQVLDLRRAYEDLASAFAAVLSSGTGSRPPY